MTMAIKRTALITGATGAVGKAIAESFAQNGYALFLSGRRGAELSKLQKVLRAYGGEVEIRAADISKEKDARRLMKQAGRIFRSLDVLVTAAGVYGEIGPLEKSDMTRWRDAMSVNLFGTAFAIRYALPLLKKRRRGKIICFAGGGDGPLPNFTSYAASKGAVLRFVESLSKELEPRGIDINAVSPGLVKSGLTRALVLAGPSRVGAEKYRAAKGELSGEAKTVPPERAAELVLFLASEKSDGITGKNISAVWDNWREFPKHLKTLGMSDIYNWRRIKPKDRGYDW